MELDSWRQRDFLIFLCGIPVPHNFFNFKSHSHSRIFEKSDPGTILMDILRDIYGKSVICMCWNLVAWYSSPSDAEELETKTDMDGRGLSFQGSWVFFFRFFAISRSQDLNILCHQCFFPLSIHKSIAKIAEISISTFFTGTRDFFLNLIFNFLILSYSYSHTIYF